MTLDRDTLLILGALAVAVIAVVVLVLVVLRTDRQRAEMAGRLQQMAETQATAQNHMSERLQAQERALTQALETRLAEVGRRVGESLEKTSERTNQTMTDLRERLARIDTAQKNITELSQQVVGLQDVLSNKQARGAFGEIQLEDLVRTVLPTSAYAFQASLGNNRRVDCLIKLPNPPGPIAIDAKFPLEAYRELRAAENDTERAAAARNFRTAIQKHVTDIRERYIVTGETAEAALMFLPSEAVYAELHANFSAVVEHSFRERVYIVSPTTLWATLNTVRAIFRDVRMREQAHVLQTELHKMLEDVNRLDSRVDKLSQHFEQARTDVEQIRISTGKVTRRAEKIQEMELDDDEADLPAPDPAPPARLRG